MDFLIILISIVIFLVLREFWCWYWKINQRNKLLEDIRKELRILNSNRIEVPPAEPRDESISPVAVEKEIIDEQKEQPVSSMDNTSVQYVVMVIGIIAIITLVMYIGFLL